MTKYYTDDGKYYMEPAPVVTYEGICEKRYYRIDRREVHFLKFVLEGYDGSAVMKTVDSKKGLVVLYIAPGCEKEVGMIIDGLRNDMRIVSMEIGNEEG